MLGDLLTVLVIIFAIAGLLLPLLLDFGLLEFVGALLTKVMRPLFKIPGRAAVDCFTSWIGDGTLGVMLTCNQYEGGYYSAREASIIATTFSAVSITFSIVVLAQVDLMEYFGLYYLTICLIGIFCAIICPRIPPLSIKKDTYLVEGKAMPESIPEQYSSGGSRSIQNYDCRLYGYVYAFHHRCRYDFQCNDKIHCCGNFRNTVNLPFRSWRPDSRLQTSG